MWPNNEGRSVGKIKAIVFMLLRRENNCVAFCGLTMKTMDFFGLSQTAAPDGSLLGCRSFMDAQIKHLSYWHLAISFFFLK